MRLVTVGWLLSVSSVLMFSQDKYSLIFERLEVVRYNTSYINSIKVRTFKFNRTQAVANITVHCKETFTDKLVLEVQAYKFASNEYRLFPLRFTFDFCKSMAVNDFGLHQMMECGNLTACPFKEGVHHSCNWFPDGRRFPPNIPSGSYKHDFKLFYHSVEIYFLNGYGTVKYPEV